LCDPRIQLYINVSRADLQAENECLVADLLVTIDNISLVRFKRTSAHVRAFGFPSRTQMVGPGLPSRKEHGRRSSPALCRQIRRLRRRRLRAELLKELKTLRAQGGLIPEELDLFKAEGATREEKCGGSRSAGTGSPTGVQAAIAEMRAS